VRTAKSEPEIAFGDNEGGPKQEQVPGNGLPPPIEQHPADQSLLQDTALKLSTSAVPTSNQTTSSQATPLAPVSGAQSQVPSGKIEQCTPWSIQHKFWCNTLTSS